MEQDGILSACSTVALWSAIHRLHTMFNVGILRPVVINTLAKYTAHNQPGALPGIGMDLHQICGVIEQMGLKAELRTMNGSLEHNVKPKAEAEVKDKTFTRKFIYAYLKMGLPILLGLEFNDGGKHLITLTGYRAVNMQKASWTRHLDQPIVYADQIQTLYAHDDQVGPFSRLVLLNDGSKVKTNRLKDPTAKVQRYESEVYSIIVPLSKDIRPTFEDIYQQTLYFESIFYELIDTDQHFIWDIYLTPSNEYRRDVVNDKATYNQEQKTKLLTKLLTEFLPPYLWVVKAEVAGCAEMEFIFDATAIPYSNNFCIEVLFFDEVLEDLIKKALTVSEEYDKERYLFINNLSQFIESKLDAAYIWFEIKKTLFQATQDHTIKATELTSLKIAWTQMIAQGDLEIPLKESTNYCKQFMESRVNEAVQLQGRYSSLMKDYRKGILTFENYSVERNKISDALLDFIKSL